MIIALLGRVILNLLFGAAAVRGWIAGIFLWIVGSILLAVIIGSLNYIFGKIGFFYGLVFVGVAVAALGIWANLYDEKATVHKTRVKLAKKQRDERRDKGINWP